MGENDAPQPVNRKSCGGWQKKIVNFKKLKTTDLIKGTQLYKGNPQYILRHVTKMVFLCNSVLNARYFNSPFSVWLTGCLQVWECVWYYFCCKLQSLPGLFSDVLRTAPGTLTPVDEQALDSARQLHCFRAELLGSEAHKRVIWASAARSLLCHRPGVPLVRGTDSGFLWNGVFLVKSFSKT